MIDRKFYKWLFLNGIKLYVKFRDRNKQSENTTNVIKNNDMNEIKELIDLLLFDFDEDDKIEVAERLNFANENPKKYLDEENNLWVLEVTNNILPFALVSLTTNYLDYFISDKIDELYEQIEEVLPEDFPEYPNQDYWDTEELFEWLDQTLVSKKVNLELVALGSNFDDNMEMVFVNRNSTIRIIELSQKLKINCTKATEMFK